MAAGLVHLGSQQPWRLTSAGGGRSGGVCPHIQSHPVFVVLALAMVHHMEFMNKYSYKVCSAYISYCLLCTSWSLNGQCSHINVGEVLTDL